MRNDRKITVKITEPTGNVGDINSYISLVLLEKTQDQHFLRSKLVKVNSGWSLPLRKH